jgi:agmatinase
MYKNDTIFYQSLVSINEANRILVGIPFDGTTTDKPGSRFGPEAIRTATHEIENYSPYLKRNITEYKICDVGNIILPFGDTERTLTIIKNDVKELLRHNTRIIFLGGEHLVSLPIIEEYFEKYGDQLFVIHFDAHADLRKDYIKTKYSHATVIHHITELIGFENFASFGVRSGTQYEWEVLESHPHSFSGLSNSKIDDFLHFVSNKLKNRKLYLTFDLDVFDPSIMPGTGAPEPGGMNYKDIITVLRSFLDYEIVGTDIVELAPNYDPSGISKVLAASLLREFILL